MTRRGASRWYGVAATIGIGVLATISDVCAKTPDVTRFTLKNGLRVVLLHVKGSNHFAAFSYLPLSLASDGKEKSQWSHLVEHLTLRTTGPIDDYRERNAETMADAMHLDFMGSLDNWREGLELQSKWLSGLPFSRESLREEVPKALSETGTTVANLFTHKWAVVAWNQVIRHGLTDVSVKEPLRKAKLADVEAYRDQHLVDPKRVVLCFIGGVSPSKLRPAVVKYFGKIASKAKELPAATHPPPKQKALSATWDLKAVHYLEAFPIPKVDHADYAPLYVASFLLRSHFNDSELRKHTGAVLCDIDLSTPERTYFQVSASVRPEVSIETVRKEIRRRIEAMSEGATAAQVLILPIQVPIVAMNLANQLLKPQDVDQALRFKSPRITEQMIVGNIGLQWGLIEYRYGTKRAKLANAVQKVTVSRVRSVVKKYLSEKNRYSLIIRPRP